MYERYINGTPWCGKVWAGLVLVQGQSDSGHSVVAQVCLRVDMEESEGKWMGLDGVRSR